MFKCEKCKKTTAPGEKLHKYPINYRDKVYQYETGNGTRKRLITTCGKEIVKEINIWLWWKNSQSIKRVCSWSKLRVVTHHI